MGPGPLITRISEDRVAPSLAQEMEDTGPGQPRSDREASWSRWSTGRIPDPLPRPPFMLTTVTRLWLPLSLLCLARRMHQRMKRPPRMTL